MTLLIKNAALAGGPPGYLTDILIRDGLITAMFGAGDSPAIQSDAHTLDARGRYVLPAFADLHTHLRTPGQTQKETLATGCAAAARGGYTVLNAMANTGPVCSTPEQAAEITRETDALGLCDVFQCVSLTRGFDGKTTDHLDALAEPCGSVRCVSEDGHGVADGAVFLDAVRKANIRGRLPLIHAEDAAFSSSDMAAAEDLETLRDLYLIEKHGCRAHFCHVSTRVSAQAIIDAKNRGVAVTWEITPHHLALNDGVDFRVNPPLRPESDRLFLVRAALSGLVDAIATDHAPHTAADKANGAPGLVGLETAFAVCHTVLCVQNGMSLSRLSDMMSANPRRLLGLPEIRIAPGFPADLTIADTAARFTIDSSEFASKGRNTPFHGCSYTGRIAATIKAGRLIYRDPND